MKITQLNGKSSNKTYKLLISEERIPCDIKIFDDKEAHLLRIKEEDVITYAKMFEDSIEHYTKSLFQILLGEIQSSFVDVNQNTVCFHKTKNMKFFSKTAENINYGETVHAFAEHLFQEKLTQNEEIIKLNQNNNKIKEEMQKGRDHLNKVIENSHKHEEQIYSCFIQLLNEKKKYIHLLKSHMNKKDLAKVNARAAKRKLQVYESESDDDEYSTDNEDEPIPKKQSRRVDPAFVTTTSGCGSKNEYSVSSSVWVESEDEDDDTLFCTALPPRVINENNQTQEVTVRMDDMEAENTEETRENREVIPRPQPLEEVKEPSQARTEESIIPSALIAYSTQDLLDDI